MTVKRQFIAGATCPQCGQVDRVQRCNDGEKIWMECIACGMKKYPDESPNNAASESANIFRGPGD